MSGPALSERAMVEVIAVDDSHSQYKVIGWPRVIVLERALRYAKFMRLLCESIWSICPYSVLSSQMRLL
jgi:hypothetical protein